VVDAFPCVEITFNFKCTLEEIWNVDSSISEETIISTLYGIVTTKDLRSLKPDQQINDSVINYIGLFLMSQKKNIRTFWLTACSQGRIGEIKNCDFNAYD
jgi:hypothetical protein